MSSVARQTLQDNKDDLDRLMEFHEQAAGTTRGRKYNVEVLNKAAVVLVCAAWEAYCEDIVAEVIRHIVNDCADYSLLPNSLKTTVAQRVKDDTHNHAPWRLAGDGWKTELANNANDVIQSMTGRWNTPKTAQIVTLFNRALGITDISTSWHWRKNRVPSTTQKIDDFVTLRGEIVHRQKAQDSVKKKDAIDFYEHACRIADKIDTEVEAVLFAATGNHYW